MSNKNLEKHENKKIFISDYIKLVNVITKILEKTGKSNLLQPLNIEEDTRFLFNTFMDPIQKKKSNTNDWSDKDWIESMKDVHLYLLSILYKKKATLYKIYKLLDNDNDISHLFLKEKLLLAYKNLINNLRLQEIFSKGTKMLLKERIEIDKIIDMEYQLLTNIKEHIQDPGNFARIIDLFVIDTFRKNVIQKCIKGVKVIEIQNLFDVPEFNEDSINSIEKYIESYCNFEVIKKLIIFIMSLNLSGKIMIHKTIYNSINSYVTGIVNESTSLKSFLNKVELELKNQDIPTYKNKIKVETIELKPDIKDKFLDSDVINIFKNIKEIYVNVYEKNIYLKFTSLQCINHIKNLIYIIVNYCLKFGFMSREEKMDFSNNIIEKCINIFQPLSDIIDLNQTREIKTELFEYLTPNNTQKNIFLTQTQNILKMLEKDLFTSDNDVQELSNLIKDFITKLKLLKDINLDTIPLKDFNLCSQFCQQLFNKIKYIQIICMKLLNHDYWINLIKNLETDEKEEHDNIIQKRFIESCLKFLNYIFNYVQKVKVDGDLLENINDNDNSETVKFKDFVMFVVNKTDIVLYYLLQIVHKKALTPQKKVIIQKAYHGKK